MTEQEKLKLKFVNPDVEEKYISYPEPVRSKLLDLRQLIFDVAANTPGVGVLEEALKWGQPSFLTSKTKSGSTIRIDQVKSRDDQYAMYFICTTNLVDRFEEQYPNIFNYKDGRSLIFETSTNIQVPELEDCIAQALLYHKNKKS